MEYILLLVGFILLIKGADFFVAGASGIAKILRIPPILIGLTIVAFGTSSPEAAVSIKAALNNNSGISIGNVIGSNIFNITFVIGLTALISPLTVQRETILKEIPFTFLSTFILLILIMDERLQDFPINSLGKSDGLVLLSFFAIFMYYLVEMALHSRDKATPEDIKPSAYTVGRNITFTLGGLGGIIWGGNLVVNNASNIAISFGMSDTLVGLTIVAVGTSLPELITSVTAALKNESEIAVGNIVGSNIFNILFVLGSSSLITNLALETKIYTDVLLLLIFTTLLFLFSRTFNKVNRKEGAILLISYVIYTIYIIMRN